MSTITTAGDEEKTLNEKGGPLIKKNDVLMSPQDIKIVCKGEEIRTHSVVLRQCKYFATLLDNADLDHTGIDNIKTITLPANFDSDPSEICEFFVVLSNTLDEADGALLIHHINKGNVIALAKLANYFDAPILQAACDRALASNHLVWFPEELPWLAQEAAKNHLPLMRRTCMTKLAADIDGTGLLKYFDLGSGALCTDPAFLIDLITALHKQHTGDLSNIARKVIMLTRMSKKLQADGAHAVLRALDSSRGLVSIRDYPAVLNVIRDELKNFDELTPPAM